MAGRPAGPVAWTRPRLARTWVALVTSALLATAALVVAEPRVVVEPTARVAYSGNLSQNPVLARHAAGYVAVTGVSQVRRTAIGVNRGARWAGVSRVARPTVRMSLPRAGVPSGSSIAISADVRAPRGSRGRLEVAWLDSGGRVLGRRAATAQRPLAERRWTTLTTTRTAPATARILVTSLTVTKARRGGRVLVTRHSVRARQVVRTAGCTCAGASNGARVGSARMSTADPGPTTEPLAEPTADPTGDPTADPTSDPTSRPTTDSGPVLPLPTDLLPPTPSPSAPVDPTPDPTPDPTADPTADPSQEPAVDPSPTQEPTVDPSPSSSPSSNPSPSPVPSPPPSTSPRPSTPPTPSPTAAPPSPPTSPPTSPAVPRVALDNTRPQPALIAYGDAARAAAYANHGSLVIAGRDNYDDPEMLAVSEAGGTVLVYLDPIIDASYGRYHQLLLEDSPCGPAAERWPGSPRANRWGHLVDFRPGSVVQRKIECVLETMVAENPHIGGFFADDVGSRSWFPDFRWESLGTRGQRAYRAGAVQLLQTFRRVADRHGLVVMANGTWTGGRLATSGGGWPDASKHGNALVDGMVAENHVPDTYWNRSYPCSSQWAQRSTVTRGMPFHLAITASAAHRRAFAASRCYAFVAEQGDYGVAAPRWGASSPTGLPHRVDG